MGRPEAARKPIILGGFEDLELVLMAEVVVRLHGKVDDQKVFGTHWLALYLRMASIARRPGATATGLKLVASSKLSHMAAAVRPQATQASVRVIDVVCVKSFLPFIRSR